MKNVFAIATALALYCTEASAQSINTILLDMHIVTKCAPFDLMDTYKKEEFDESILLLGETFVQWVNGDQTGITPATMGFYVNQDTGTWTMSVAFSDGMMCDVLFGKEFTPY
jgi:hypothetical protein